MANNVFQAKRTNVSGRTPNTTASYATNSQYIAAGEFALNMADGILYTSNGSTLIEVGANNTSVSVTGTLTINSISANNSLGSLGQVLKSNGSTVYWETDTADIGDTNQVLYRNSSNVLTTSSGLQYDGVSLKVNGNLESVYQNGDEGGEIYLNKPVTNTSINSGVTIDVYQNKLRIFEAGGTNRGAFIDLTAANAGVGSNLLGGGGGTGTVTSVGSGDGLTGGPITGSGTLSVLANNGIIANSTGVFVNGGVGTTVNSTGVHVRANNGINVTLNGVFVNGNNGLTVNSTGVHVLANTGIVANSTGTFVNATYIGTISANNASFLGGTAAASYVQNTDSRTLSGNLNLTGTNTTISTNLSVVNSTATVAYFASGGNVGIGNTTPDAKLAVTGTANIAGNVVIGGTSHLISGNVNFDLGTLFVDASNNTVGVGNTAPNHRLSVNGDAFVGNTVIVGNSTVNATINSTAFTGSANNTNFVGSVSAANVVSNAQLSANLANYQTTAGLSANVATLTSNNATYFGGYTWAAPAVLGSSTANGASLTYANVTGQVNTATLYVSTSANLAGQYSNSTGLYPTSNTVGSAFGNGTSRWSIVANDISTGLLSVGARFYTSATSSNFEANSYLTGNILLGGVTQTGYILVGQSTNNQTVAIANGATVSGNTKTVEIATNGAAGSQTNITVGASLSNTLITVNANNTVFSGGVYPSSNAIALGNTTARWVINANTINGSGDWTTTGNVSANNANTTFDLTVGRNLTVTGNLTILGSSTVLQGNAITFSDNMLYLNQGILATITGVSGNGTYIDFTANNNFQVGWDVFVSGVTPSSYNGNYQNIFSANSTHFTVANTNTDTYVSGGTARGKTDQNPDLGIAAGYNDGTYHHTGLFRDASDGFWKVFDNYAPEPDAAVNIDTSNLTFHTANFWANTIQVGNTTVYSTINTTSFDGTSNNTNFVGTVSAANVVSNAQLSANLGNYQTTAGLSANVATLTANNTSFVGTVSAANVVSNAQLSANLSNYVTTTALTNNLANYQTTAGLSANVATLTANNTSFVGSVSAANVVSNAQLSANLGNYQTTAGLSANVATLTANNSTYLNGQLASYYTNATNITTGTLPYAQIPANIINTTANFTISGVQTYNANVVLGAGLSANGGFGSAGEVLHSNGTATYWATQYGFLDVTSAGGTTTLTSTSPRYIRVTGSLTQTIVLPAVSTLPLGTTFLIHNLSSGQVFIQSSGLNQIVAPVQNHAYEVRSVATTGTGASVWQSRADGSTAITGTGNIIGGFRPTLQQLQMTSSTSFTAGTDAQGQGALSENVTVITTTASNPSGVTLPAAGGFGTSSSRVLVVINKGTNPVNVYPVSGGQIDALGTNVAASLPVGGVMTFYNASTTQWYSTINNIGNATNITTGTLPYAQIPANVINTTAEFTRTGITTFNANVILGSSGLSANGGFGTAGQVLTSNGTATYWSPAGSGSVDVNATYAWTNDHTFAGNVAIGGVIQSDTTFFINDLWTIDAGATSLYTYAQDQNTSMTAIRNKYASYSAISNRNQNKSSDGLTTYNSNYRSVVGDVYNGSTSSGGNAFASEIIGGNFRSYNYANGSGANGVNGAYGTRNQSFSFGTGTISSAYGSQNQVLIGNSTATGNITTAYGVYSEVQSNTAATIGTGYLYYGQYTGSTTTTKYGLYITGESNNYISSNVRIQGATYMVGNVGIGVNAQTDTQLQSSITWTSDLSLWNQYNGTTDSNTAMTAARIKYGFQSSFSNRNQNKSSDGLTTYSATYRAVDGRVFNGSSSTGGDAYADELQGGSFRAYNYANGATSNTVSNLRGVYSEAVSYGSGVVSFGFGSYSRVGIGNSSATGNVTTGYAVAARVESNTSATIADGYLFHGRHDGSTTTNKWGVYLLNETKSYFSGNVGIGNTVPTDKLSVNGTTYLGANLTLTSVLIANGGAGTAGQVLTSNGTTGAPYWSTVSGGSGSVNVNATYAWTNTHTFAANVAFNANVAIAAALSANGSQGTAGQVLTAATLGNTYWSTLSLFNNITIQTFTSGTGASYTAPGDLKYAIVFATGGGGGGGGADVADTAAGAGGGGGGAGATVIGIFTAAQMTGATYTIGAGGTAGLNTGTNGAAGGTTTFTPSGGATALSAGGGALGTGTGSGFTVGGRAPGGNGGTGTGGGIAIAGGQGITGVGDDIGEMGIGGNGGASYWGGGGSGGKIQGSGQDSGKVGSAYGSGGGGGSVIDQTTGGAGGDGLGGVIMVIEFRG